MALTAARTELNVSLTGEDETARMLEDAKKRVAALEAQTGRLTNATKAQTQAAQSSQSVMESTNGKLKGLAERAEGVVGGVDKVKGAFEKVVGAFGFMGMAVTGVITAYEFLSEAFDDSEEKAAAQAAQLEATRVKTEQLKAATDALASSLAAFGAITAGAGSALAQQRLTIAKLEGDTVKAAKLTLEAEAQAAKDTKKKIEEDQAKATKTLKETEIAENTAKQAVQKAQDDVRKIRQRQSDLEENSSVAIFERDKERAKERKTQLAAELNAAKAALVPQQQALELATKARQEGEKATSDLAAQAHFQSRIVTLMEERAAKGPEPEVKPTGGGGGGGGGAKKEDPDAERKRREEEEKAEAARLEALRLEEEARAKILNLIRQASELQKVEISDSLKSMQEGLSKSLATLPVDPAFDKLRQQTKAQMDAVNEQIAIFSSLANLQDDQLVISATDQQAAAVDKLTESYKALGEATVSAREESQRLAEQLEKDKLSGYVYDFSESLRQLSEIQSPVFDAVTESLAGVSAQMQKFQSGQQTLTQAVVGSGAAIAGAVAKQIDNVRVEAGIRALFETAMGFANLGNPAVAVGHFTAAAMFGLVAGGLIPAAPKSGPSGGGQKAPAKDAASKEMSGGQGGGQITNVYNLQTGIIDGQSTARAFRQAEAQARNTGMASAGGW